jgi:hypothetical protein
LVRPPQHYRSYEDHYSGCDFHVHSTTKPFAYSALF